MHARSSSYHALGRATGHVRRASRTATDFAAATAALSSSGAPSPTGSTSDVAPPSWLDFSPRVDTGLPPARPSHKRAAAQHRAHAFPPGAGPPAAAVALRHNKSAQRLYADARVAVKVRTRALLPRKLLLAVAAMFFPLAFVLFHLLKRSYGMQAAPPVGSVPDAASNARRIARGFAPVEYWPFRFRTRLRHGTPISKVLALRDVLAVRARGVKRSNDYRFARRDDALPPSRFPLRVSLIAACKDRTGFLQSALPSWRTALSSYDEIVLVDWGTSTVNHVPLMAVVEAVGDQRISLITVRNTSSWMLSRAYNLALRQARGEWILKVDCDTMLTPNLLHFNSLPPAPIPSSTSTPQSLTSHIATNLSNAARYYYRFSRGDAQHENDQYLAGVTLVHSDDLRAVFGYDERIVTYGWENIDLYKRLERSVAENGRELTPKPFVEQTVNHVQHSAKFRLGDQKLVSGAALQVEINRLSLLSLRSWHSSAQERCTYSYKIASSDARYVFATPEITIRSSFDQLSAAMREDVLKEARTRLLHNEYGIPLDVLSEISRSRAELVRELDRLVRESEWAPGAGAIFAEVSGSPAQRLLGVASAVALSSEYKRPLFLAWRAEHPRRHSRHTHEARVEDVLDLAGAAERGVHVFQIGTWRCQVAVSDCASADASYSSMTEYSSNGDSRTARAVLDLLQRRQHAPDRRNIFLRLEHAFEQIPREWLIRAFRKVRPAAKLSRVLEARRDVLRTRQGVYLGPRLRRTHNIDAFAQRLRRDTTAAGETAPAFFVAGTDRALVRHARRALDAHLDMEAGGVHFDSGTVEFGELYALALCSAMVNDGRTPRDVFDAVALIRAASDAGDAHLV